MEGFFTKLGLYIDMYCGDLVLDCVLAKFCQFLTKLSARNMSVFSFPDDNFNKYQWIFTNLVRPLIFLESCFGFANGQILSIFYRVNCLWHIPPYFHLRTSWVNLNGFSPNLICALILWRSGLWLLMGKFRQFLTEICPWHNNGGMLLFRVCLCFLFECIFQEK